VTLAAENTWKLTVELRGIKNKRKIPDFYNGGKVPGA
jgi:hypothetical protein